MRALLLVALAACTAHAAPTPACPEPPPPPAPAPIAPPAGAPAFADDAVIAQSHAFFDALDRYDVDAVTGALAAGTDKDAITKPLTDARDQHAAPSTRSWSGDHVVRAGDAVVFVGYATAHAQPAAGAPGHDEEGSGTLVWIIDGGAWKIAHEAWTPKR